MEPPSKYQVYAQSLLADIGAAATGLLPRRDVLIGWLEDFLVRAARKGFQIERDEVETLTALDTFVRVNKIAASLRVELD